MGDPLLRRGCSGVRSPRATEIADREAMARIGSTLAAMLVGGLALLPARAENYTDLWWNPAESGWGLSLNDHETQLFGVWYTYGADGAATWFVLPGGTFSRDRRIFTGDLYQTSGPPYNVTFSPSMVRTQRAGSVRIDFAPAGLSPGTALFTASVGTVSQTRQIQRQAFGDAPASWPRDYSDIWWDPSESGWGLTLAQHGNNIFGVWFTYGPGGQPLFVVLPGVAFAGPAAFSGTLYTSTGPHFARPAFDPAEVRVTAVGNASIVFNGPIGTFASTVNGHTQVKTIVRQRFGLEAPSDTPIGGRLLWARGLWAGFERRGWPNGYHSGDLIRDFDKPDAELQQLIGPGSTSATVRDEVALQLDRMRAMGVNLVVLELRSTDANFLPGPRTPPECNVAPALGLLYPRPAARDLANLVAFLDLLESKGMRVLLVLNNTHMEEQPALNNSAWLGSIIDAVKGHAALDTLIFGGDAHTITVAGAAQCGGQSEAPLWLGPRSYAGAYVKWALAHARARGVPAGKLSAEAIVGNYFIDSLPPPAGDDAADASLWHPVVAMKRIFDELSWPEPERTYALSLYSHRKCLNPNALPGSCSDAGAHAWMDESLGNVRRIVGDQARVIAAEFGVYDPASADWSAEQAFESVTALMALHGVEGGAWWTWTEIDDATQSQRGAQAIKRRGLDFSYNPVQRELVAAYGWRLSAIPNGSFEDGGATPARWALAGEGNLARVRLTDEGPAPSIATRGVHVLRLVTGPAPMDAVAASSEAIAASPNTSYVTTASLRFRWAGDGGSGDRASRPHVYASVRYFDARGAPSALRAADTFRYYQENATNGFATFPLSYTTPADARAVRVEFGAARNGLAQRVTLDVDYVR